MIGQPCALRQVYNGNTKTSSQDMVFRLVYIFLKQHYCFIRSARRIGFGNLSAQVEVGIYRSDRNIQTAVVTLSDENDKNSAYICMCSMQSFHRSIPICQRGISATLTELNSFFFLHLLFHFLIVCLHKSKIALIIFFLQYLKTKAIKDACLFFFLSI